MEDLKTLWGIYGGDFKRGCSDRSEQMVDGYKRDLCLDPGRSCRFRNPRGAITISKETEPLNPCDCSVGEGTTVGLCEIGKHLRIGPIVLV